MRSTAPFSFLLVLSAAAGGFAQTASPAGRYDFRTVTAEGDSLAGTIYVTDEKAPFRGYVFTDARSALPIRSATARPGGVVVVAAINADIDITFELDLDGATVSGTWAFADQSNTLTGKRVETNEWNDLEPVSCRVPNYDGEALCGFKWVYEDRVAARGRLIPLYMVILPATGADRAPDPLFHFAGGPGQAATELAAGNARRFAAIRERRDIVMVDQRGTGRSNGLRCDFEDAESLTRAVMAWDMSRRDIERCLAELEPRADVRFYHTAIAMDDIDEVRDWLGYERINLYGGSYGTRAALTYMRRHPDRVRTATIRGVLSPAGMLNLDNPRDAQVSLERLFQDCASDAACAAAFPNLAEDFAEVLGRLSETPVALATVDPRTGDSVTIAIDREVFASGVRRFLMDANAQSQLPYAIQRAAAGDFRAFEPGIRNTLAVFGSLYLGMGLSVVCTEDAPRLAAVDIDEYTRGTFLGPNAPRAIARVCEHYPTEELPPGYTEPVRVDAPTLILSGALDPTTPARWGEEVADALPNSLHLVMEGISHSPFPSCALDIMARFVERGSVAGLDTACLADLRRPAFETGSGSP